LIDDSSQRDKHTTTLDDDDNDDDDEEFVYPSSPATVEHGIGPSPSREAQPSPAQLESLYAAASSGDLPLLKRLFKTAVENGQVEPFSLANHASTRTGFTALHTATSRGYHDIAVWCELILRKMSPVDINLYCLVIEDCGAMPDLEDREGEVSLFLQLLILEFKEMKQTALHKAALNGHITIIQYLLPNKADVNASDADGWTALHNACSKV